MPLGIVLVFIPARTHRLPEHVRDLPADEPDVPRVVVTARMPGVAVKSHCNAVGIAPAEEVKLSAIGTLAPAAAVAEETCNDTVCPKATHAIKQQVEPKLIIVLTTILSSLNRITIIAANRVVCSSAQR
jgi:hypothetical protein